MKRLRCWLFGHDWELTHHSRPFVPGETVWEWTCLGCHRQTRRVAPANAHRPYADDHGAVL